MRTRRLFIVMPGLLALLAAAAACTTTPSAPRVPSGAGPSTAHQARPASRPVRASGTASSVTLAFAGDVHFTGRTARLLSDPATAFGPAAVVLRSVDFAAVNLETPVTSRGAPQPKAYHFRTTPVAFTALRDAGIDLVTMANNHVLDYGTVGLADTLAAARAARFPYVGIGADRLMVIAMEAWSW
jgi:Bacterial capsule synthesis protein PGA_cap